MGRWLKKVINPQDRAPTKPGFVSSVSTLPGDFAKNDPLPAGDPPGPAHDIDTIIDVLAHEVGRPLGKELVLLIRQAMRPMSRKARAELAAAIDDCFEHAESDQAGRQQAETLVRLAST